MKGFFLQLVICNEISKTCGSLFYMLCSPACWLVPMLHGVEDEANILQDYLDDHDTKDVKDMIGSALYPYLCEICFSLSAPKTSVDLRCTAYNILSDSAASHHPNQEKLRDKDVLGGERLGSCIWRTKDYLAIEGLLNLFARAIPSTHNNPAGRSRRTAYIHSVFKSCAPQEATATGDEIVELLENVPTSNWDDTAMKIVDVLARGNISYPQPFAVAEVIACSHVYRSDRLYADDKVLLVNVLLGDDQCESLTIAYSSIQDIDVSQSAQDAARVTVSVREPPRLRKDRITAEQNTDAALNLDVVIVFMAKDVPQLIDVLLSRGLSHAVHKIPGASRSPHVPKLSLAADPANLELDSAGRFAKEPSQTERIETVSQIYRTNEPSDPIMSPGLPPDSPPLVLGTKLSPALPQTKLGSVADNTSGRNKRASLARAESHLMRAAAFGLSDEELSEISDYDSPLPRSKVLRRSSTSTSLVRGRISFQPLLSTSTGTNSSATRVARGGVGKVVLGSDDDSPPAALTSPASRRAKRKAALIRDPTLEDSQPASVILAPALPAPVVPAAMPAPVVPVPFRVSTTTADAPVTPSQLPGDDIPVSSSGPGKVLRFSDIPAPNFNAPLSSPAVVPKSALKSALVKKLAPSRLANPVSLESALCATESVPLATASIKDLKASAIKASDMLDDLAPPSSSPTPGAKQSVRSRLRKKEENAHTTGKLHNVTSVKRKSIAPDGADDPEPLAALGNETSRPAKRARTVVPIPPPKGILDERSESTLLRPRTTAATRATKRYHAKGARTSSPTGASNATRKKRVPSVDYDALPSPPRPPTAVVKPSSPIPVPQEKPAAKSKPKAAVKAKADANPKKETKARKADGAAAIAKKPAGAVPARKAATRAPKNAEQEMGETRDGEQTAPTDDRPSVAPEVPESRRPQRAQRKKATAAVRVNPHDRNADVEDLPPTEEYMDDAVVPSFSDFAAPQVDCDVPEPSNPSKKRRGGDSEVVIEKVAAPMPISASKKSSATPWDEAFENVPEVVSRVEEAPHVSVELPSAIGAEDERMEIDEASPPEPQNTTAERVFAAPEPAFKAPRKPPVRSEGAATGTQHQTPSTIPKKLDTAPSTHCTPNAPSKCVSTLPPAVVKVETIDLTLDSPPKPTKLASVPVRGRVHPPAQAPPQPSAPARSDELKHKMIAAEDDDADILDFMKQARTAQLHRTEDTLLRARVFTPEHEDPPLPIFDRRRDVAQRRQVSPSKPSRERGTVFGHMDMGARKDSFSSDHPHRLVDVLGRLHDAVVYNTENKFEGVRHHARLGRNELVRNAVADLVALRAESVAQFNNLVDLEAEYATSGRGLIRGSEDWLKTNRELDRSLTQVLEQHDRTMLSKKMPPKLITMML
ncbi:hypothetical protein TRAPUB_4867 [Trametes pubescens]|uniref:Uncharacterized protein n=1 Tax=Trametes pubescens TaxID=154538 RepID=A0A1M2V9U3_TRAPU|nr:hypothetical protein TRAPUB_4867 [Trametes pubescens]